MKKYNFIRLFSLAIMGTLLAACADNVGDNIRTKKMEMMGEYLLNKAETFSEFHRVLEKAEMLGILNSYGEYTCFAPNNSAVNAFFAASEFGSLEAFPADSLKKIVLYQLIEDDAIDTEFFTSSRLRSPNMAGDNLQVRYDDKDGSVILNGVAKILSSNIEVKNGIIHVTNAFILPDSESVASKLEDPAFEGRYDIFLQALKETGVDMLMTDSDDPREFSYIDDKGVKIVVPRRLRYTVLIESNELYKSVGIESYQALKDLYSPNSNDVTNPSNGLYRYMAYHCLDRIYDEQNFIDFAKQDGYEVVETMCTNTLLEFRKIPEGVVFNRATDPFTSEVIAPGVPMTKSVKWKNILANNGMLHEIDQPLEIPDQEEFFYKKIRFNICSFMPELLNLGVRGKKSQNFPDAMLYGSKGMEYFKNMKIIGEGGKVVTEYGYWDGAWITHQWDEILIGERDPSNCRADVTITIPPIPAGTWEIRFGFSANGNRGMTQLYFDGVPSGVPLNMGPGENYGITGMDKETAFKVFHSNGFMPYPANIANRAGRSIDFPTSDYDRLRRVLGIYSFSQMKSHELRFKSVEPGGLALNFIEVIPVDQIAGEDYN